MDATPQSADRPLSADALKPLAMRFLMDVIRNQRAMLDLQQPKRAALVACNWLAVRELEQKEDGLQQRLRELMQKRADLLLQFRQAGSAGRTLEDVGRHHGWHQETDWSRLTDAAKKLGQQLQQSSWGIWVLAQRAGRYYAQVLDVIAQGGQKQPCYQQNPDSPGGATGGSLLDASI